MSRTLWSLAKATMYAAPTWLLVVGAFGLQKELVAVAGWVVATSYGIAAYGWARRMEAANVPNLEEKIERLQHRLSWQAEVAEEAQEQRNQAIEELEAWKRDEAHALWVMERIGREMGRASREPNTETQP